MRGIPTFSLSASDAPTAWLTLLEGLLGVGVGVITYRGPLLTGLGLLIYIATWSQATGVLETAAAIRFREELKKEWWLLVTCSKCTQCRRGRRWLSEVC